MKPFLVIVFTLLYLVSSAKAIDADGESELQQCAYHLTRHR